MEDTKFREKIGEEWEKFYKTGETDSKIVRGFILSSWQRSRRNGVNPLKLGENRISDEKKEQVFTESSDLIKIAVPVMDKLYKFIEGSESIITLTNEKSIILHTTGDDLPLNPPDILSPGKDFSEEKIGTNGVGTCIAEDRPIQIWGEEHYFKDFKIWYCSAATIHNSNGDIIGSLNISCLKDRMTYHTLGMVSSASDSIEEQLKIEAEYRKKFQAMKEKHAVFELISDGIIITDPDLTVIHLNRSALKLLGIAGKNPESIVGSQLSELITSGADFNLILKEGKNISDREATLGVRNGVLNCLMSLIVSGSSSSGLVVTLKESGSVHKIVNRVTGSRAELTFDNIIGDSASIKKAFNLAKIAAESRSNTLILGENGTGKEMFAQGIHNAGEKRDEPFIALNCGALPRDLLQSELFGYEGGAFTGSRRDGNPGKFELADGGTILLDEIGDMPLDAQVSLLRVIQNSEVVRVGGSYPRKIDVRIIASTNKDLVKAVADNTFREDLYFRLNVLSIIVPPLRERRADITTLAMFFQQKAALSLGKEIFGIDKEVLDIFRVYRWPGNVRELENVIERAVNVSKGDSISIDSIPDELAEYARSAAPKVLDSVFPGGETLMGKEIDTIINELENSGGNLRKTALQLGIARSTLYGKLKKFGISVETFRKN